MHHSTTSSPDLELLMARADAAFDRAGGRGLEATSRYIRDVRHARDVIRPEQGRGLRALRELAARRWEVANG